MARPVKWSRDLHPIRERAARSRTETWSRREVEDLFGVGRASAQSLMKAIGEVQPVGGAHFIDRASLLSFLDTMIAAPTVEEGMRDRAGVTEPTPKRKPLRISLPADLRAVLLHELPPSILLSPGRLQIEAPTAEAMLESLGLLALALQNDLEAFRNAVDCVHSSPHGDDDELKSLMRSLRSHGGNPEVQGESKQEG